MLAPSKPHCVSPRDGGGGGRSGTVTRTPALAYGPGSPEPFPRSCRGCDRMAPDDPAFLSIAAICFAGAAATFLVFFGPGLIWRVRAWSWVERTIFAAAVAGLASLTAYIAALLIR